MVRRMTLWVALVGVVGSGGSAIAQTAPPSRPASLQQCSPAQVCEPPRSLTVVGQGQVTAPADTALLEFRISVREPITADRTVDRTTASSSPGLSIQSLRKFTEDALKPTVEALLKAGVPQRHILIQSSSLQNPKLLVKVEKPTQERLQQIVLSVDQALQPDKRLFLQSIGAVYSVNLCDPLERAARRLAIADAQRQVLGLAQDLSVPLGTLISASTAPLTGSPNSTACGSRVGVALSTPNPFMLPASEQSLPPYDPAELPEVKIRSQVTLTHRI
jgi:uncharacterized protein YggE